MPEMPDTKEITAQVTLEQMKQYMTQFFHGYKQDPASSDFQRGHLASMEEFADFFNLR